MDSEEIVKRLNKVRTAINKLTKELEKINELLKDQSNIKITTATLYFK